MANAIGLHPLPEESARGASLPTGPRRRGAGGRRRAEGVASRFVAAALAVLLAACGAGLLLLGPANRAVSGDAGVAVVTARRSDFVRTLRLSGTTEAVAARGIIAPRLAGASFGLMVITSIVPNGTRVKKGEVLVEFDREEQYKDFLAKQAAYHDLASQYAVKGAGEEAARAADDAALKQAEDALATAQLEVKKNELVTAIQAEINDETLKEDETTLKQLRQTYALKRQTGAAGVRDLEIQAQRARQTMLNAQENMQKMTIRSPMDGIAILTEVYLGGTMGNVQAGSTVYPGSGFMRVVDPSRMQVSALVNQADEALLKAGQSAVIHLEAYPDFAMPGRVEELSPLGQPSQFSSRVVSFSAIFSIEGSSPRLMPDLTADVDVELARVPNAVVVPIESVASDGVNSYVWLKTGGSFTKRQVRTGPENDLDIVIESGLAPGDAIRKYADETGGGPQRR